MQEQLVSSWQPSESSFTPSIRFGCKRVTYWHHVASNDPLISGGDLVECMPTGHSSHLNKSPGTGTAGPPGRQEPRPPRTQDCCTLLTTLSTLEIVKRELDARDWDIQYVFICYMHQECIFLQVVSEKLFVCVCVYEGGKERPENKKESLLFYTIFHSRIWKMNSNRKRGRLSSLSIWFLMQAPELCIIFSTLWWERDIKILLEVFLFFPLFHRDHYTTVLNAYYARKATIIHPLQCISVNFVIISALQNRGKEEAKGA